MGGRRWRQTQSELGWPAAEVERSRVADGGGGELGRSEVDRVGKAHRPRQPPASSFWICAISSPARRRPRTPSAAPSWLRPHLRRPWLVVAGE